MIRVSGCSAERDIIVIFPRIIAPVVNRAKGQYYLLIGDLYLHRYMHGELLQDTKFIVQDITLY